MDEHLDFLFDDDDAPTDGGGIRIPWSVAVSFVFHVLFIAWIVHNYHPPKAADTPAPIVRYVELMRQQPKNFTEAPGPKTATAPLTAAYSDANRKASAPQSTGTKPTTRPGDGSNTLYTPRNGGGDGRRAQAAAPPMQQAAQQPNNTQQAAQQAAAATQQLTAPSSLAELPPASTTSATIPAYRGAAGAVDLRQAIREVGKIASLGSGQQGNDLGNPGGEKGFVAEGPVSFETQWYDWGEYAEGMVNRIRVNWYGNMPPLIQTGMKGVVTIRFTIHRDGSITEVVIIKGSGVPPYDFAAKKAIELASPLAALPKDFPNETERVTAMFFYNQDPGKH
jgi:TonB family protein